MSYAKLAHDVSKGSIILCADGSISLEVRVPSGRAARGTQRGQLWVFQAPSSSDTTFN